MLFSTVLVSMLAGLAAAAPTERAAESHKVVINNRCGKGTGVFMTGSTKDKLFKSGSVINGPLRGGKAWVDGVAGCEMSGKGCGVIEFTLINKGTDGANTHSSVNYSLQSQGNHKYKHRMAWKYTGSCTHGPPGPCVGPSAKECPGAYIGTNTFSGVPVQCTKNNAGIHITFC